MHGKVIYFGFAVAFGVGFVLLGHSLWLLALAILYTIYLWRIHDKKIMTICTSLMLLAGIFTHVYDARNETKFSREETTFVGVIHSMPVIDGDSLRFTLRTDGEKLQLSYQLRTEEEKEKWEEIKVGTYLQVEGKLKEPPTSRNDNEFNYRTYLYRQHVHHILDANQLSISPTISSSIYYKILRIRQAGIGYIRTHFPEEIAPFAEALLYGEREQFSPGGYEKLGLVHLLALSGTHVSIMLAGCYYLLLRIGLTRETGTALLLASLPVYILLAGAGASIIRAGIMGMVMLLAVFTKKRFLALDVLASVFLGMIFFRPYFLVETGFLLSFFTSFSLILSSWYITKLPKLGIPFAVSICAQLSSLPMILFSFYEISPYSWLLNVIFAPFITLLILPLLFLAFFTHLLLPTVGMIFLWIASQLLTVAQGFLSLVEKLSFSTMIFEKPSLWWIFLFYVVLYFFYVSVERGKERKWWALGILGLLFLQWIPWSFSDKVTFIDVGQGDSILLQVSDQVYLIDVGGVLTFQKESWRERKEPFDTGRHIVVPYLKSQGIRKVDKVIITHGHADHGGGIFALLDEIKVGEIVLGHKEVYNDLEQAILQASAAREIPTKIVQSGEQLGTFHVLAPFDEKMENENERSIVLYGAIGEYTWLFTGDLEADGEKKLLAMYPNVTADILKVGHHGSITSTTEDFFTQVSPKIAVILAGVNNRFNHPHPEVLERLSEIRVYRTDVHGMITYCYFHGKSKFQTHLPDER